MSPFECTGIIEIGGYKIRCHNYTNGAEGWLTIGESIERSCNVTLIRMAQVIGIDEFLKYMSEYNFGLKTNIDLAGEARTASWYSILQRWDLRSLQPRALDRALT